MSWAQVNGRWMKCSAPMPAPKIVLVEGAAAEEILAGALQLDARKGYEQEIC